MLAFEGSGLTEKGILGSYRHACCLYYVGSYTFVKTIEPETKICAL